MALPIPIANLSRRHNKIWKKKKKDTNIKNRYHPVSHQTHNKSTKCKGVWKERKKKKSRPEKTPSFPCNQSNLTASSADILNLNIAECFGLPRITDNTHPESHPSYLRGRGTLRRSIVTTSTGTGVVRIRRRLQFDAILLRVRLGRGAEVSVLSRVGRVLRWRLLGVVRVWSVRLLIDWLVWGRRTWWRSHPACTGVWSLTVASASSGIEAAGGCQQSWNQRVVWSEGMNLIDLRKTEEEDECAADNNSERYPATPAVPVGAIIAVIAAVARGS